MGLTRNILRGQVGGKALGPHPAFMDPGTPVGITDLNIIRRSGAGGVGRVSQQEAQRHLTSYGGDQAMDWVMDCVRFTADTVASAAYHFEDPSNTAGRQVPGPAMDPPPMLTKLLESPNPYMDYTELIELLVIDLLLVGNAYWFKYQTNNAGQPLAIYRLAPPHVKVVPKPWGIDSYEYSVPGMDKLEIDAASVVHFKLANPHSPYYGLGLIQGAGRSADMELALADTEASYFENAAMPSLTVQSDRRVPRDVFKKIRAQLRARTQGPSNAGELLVLEAGLKVASISPSAQQAAFAELSRLSRDRILAWFRISPKLLGILDEAGGADKISDAQRLYDTKTARPLMNKLQRKISAELVAAWSLAYKIDYEYQMAPEDMARLAGTYASIPGVMIDEVRAFAHLGPHPDERIGKMTINLPGQNGGTGQPGDTPTRNGFPDPGLPGEAGRPPLIENTKPFPTPGQPLPPGSSAVEGKAASSIAEVMARLEVLTALPEGKAAPPDTSIPGEIRPEDTLATRRTAEVDAIVAELTRDLSTAARTLERGLLDTVEGKAFSPSDLVKRIRSSSAWATFTQMAEAALRRGITRALSTAAVHHGDLGIKPDAEIDYEALANELVNAGSITRTLKERVAKTVRESRDAGQTKAEIQAALQGAMADWMGSQAETVALTEATRGYNEGTIAVAEAAGLDHVLVSDGEDHDEPCKEANGQTWTLEQARAAPLEHPRCRRAFVPIAPVSSPA